VKLLDTIILVSAMNLASKYHKTGMPYLTTLQSAEEGYVPTSTLTEFDLIMRNLKKLTSWDIWRAIS
jgi:hypothetical protein